MSLTPTQFYAYTGKSSVDFNVNYLTYLLSSVDQIITDTIGSLFTLVQIDDTNTDINYQYMDFRGSNTNLIKTGAWQKDGLVVKLGNYPFVTNPTLTTLIENQDYLIKYYQNRKVYGRDNPVIGIELLNNKLYSDQFIRVTGIFGWSNGYPPDLNQLIYQLVLNNLYNNQSIVDNEGEAISSEKSANLSINYDTTAQNQAQSQAISIMSNSEVKKILNKYKQNSITQIQISK